MTLLSRKADYALLILSHLHRGGEAASAREIAEHYGLSRGFVANILKELCQKGFVTSTRGAKGGYVLERPADEVSVADLLDGLDDGFRLAECSEPHEDAEPCSLSGTCPVRGAVAGLHERLSEMLRGVMLAELFAVPDSGGRLISPPVLAGTRE